MSIELSMPELTEMTPKITVVGVGGAGGNAINNMIEAELQGVDFVAANTDAQALSLSLASNTIQLGSKITQGLGAGAKPEVGKAAAEESLAQLEDMMDGSHMVFITAGMGGGTGTGAAPVVAKMAKERGILTVGVVTKPFHFEGSRRMSIADAGITALQEYVDTLIIIPNQNLFRIATEKTTFADAFALADQVLHSGVRGITDLMVMPGLINLDFADIKTVMNSMGKAMMGTGEADGENRAVNAAEAAISNPLLDEVDMQGAKGVIINITGGMDLTLFEVDEAANYIRSQVDPDANIIVGSAFNPELDGKMRVSVVATGLEEGSGVASMHAHPAPQRAVARPTVAKPVEAEKEAPSFDISADQIEEAPKAEATPAQEAGKDELINEEPAEEAIKALAAAAKEEADSQTADASKDEQSSTEKPLQPDLMSAVQAGADAAHAERGQVLEKVAELVQSDTPLKLEEPDDEAEADLEDHIQGGGFVADKPVQPKKVADPKGKADQTAEEALKAGPSLLDEVEKEESAPTAEQPAKNDRGGQTSLSLFERLTQNFRSNDASRPSREDPKVTAETAETNSDGASTGDKGDDPDDDLNIPSFLKKVN